jgi:hypothetical protein
VDAITVCQLVHGRACYVASHELVDLQLLQSPRPAVPRRMIDRASDGRGQFEQVVKGAALVGGVSVASQVLDAPDLR